LSKFATENSMGMPLCAMYNSYYCPAYGTLLLMVSNIHCA